MDSLIKTSKKVKIISNILKLHIKKFLFYSIFKRIFLINKMVCYDKLDVTIYMLHRCSPFETGKLFSNENMKVSPEFLKNFILEKRKTHEFISLDDFYTLANAKSQILKKFIILTFDDGYLDNFEFAFPIFEELNVPFTVYVTTCFPDRTAFLWWYILEDIILKHSTVKLSTGEVFTCVSNTEKEESFLNIRKIILNLNQMNLRSEFDILFSSYEYIAEKYNERLCLSWDNIIQMSKSKCCTIGAHTENHKVMKLISENEMQREIFNGKLYLENKIGIQVSHFAFPFGTDNEVGDREKRFIANCGFNTVTLADGGNISDLTTINLFSLPRIFLSQLNK